MGVVGRLYRTRSLLDGVSRSLKLSTGADSSYRYLGKAERLAFSFVVGSPLVERLGNIEHPEALRKVSFAFSTLSFHSYCTFWRCGCRVLSSSTFIGSLRLTLAEERPALLYPGSTPIPVRLPSCLALSFELTQLGASVAYIMDAPLDGQLVPDPPEMALF